MRRSLVTFVVLTLVLGLMGCKKAEEETAQAEAPQKETVAESKETDRAVPVEKPEGLPEFTILNERPMSGAGISWNILVSEKTSREDAMKLGEFLRKKYKPKGLVYVSMYDSREAFEHAGDKDSPVDFMKHYLVQVTVIPKANVDTVIWMAKGRDY